MICQWCKKSFPHRKGRFCGGCQKPKAHTVKKPKKELPIATLTVRGFATMTEKELDKWHRWMKGQVAEALNGHKNYAKVYTARLMP